MHWRVGGHVSLACLVPDQRDVTYGQAPHVGDVIAVPRTRHGGSEFMYILLSISVSNLSFNLVAPLFDWQITQVFDVVQNLDELEKRAEVSWSHGA
jgi:hypothetical protein